jgi:hypothetical protein
MKLWQRAVLMIVSVAALYALWRSPVAGIGSIVMGVVGVGIGRSIFRSKLAPNPMGENRDYSLRPGTTALLKAIGWFSAAMLWALLGGYAIRMKYLPDNSIGGAVLAGPIVLLLTAAGIYLSIAMATVLFGIRPSGGGSNDA